MGQQRLRNFEHSILSFEHNIFNLGFHSPGRYLGFDTIVKIGGLQFYLAHTDRNLTYMDPNNAVTGPIGVYLTPQGTIIQETANIGPFNIDSNLGNVNYRYDLIYAIHNQIEFGGGQAATYAIIKGSIAAPDKPTVPDPLIHTPLGYVELPPGEPGDINNCKWLKSRCPDSGDGPDARLNEVNIFSSFQGYALSQILYKVPSKIDAAQNQFWSFDNDGNTFKVFPDVTQNLDAIGIKNVIPQEGHRIFILINHNVRLFQTFNIVGDDPLSIGNFRGINMRGQFYPPIADPGGVILGPGGVGVIQNLGRPAIYPGVDEIWELTLIYMDGRWVVTNIGGKKSLVPTAPNLDPYADNRTQVLPGNTPGEFIIYTPPFATKYPILFVGSFHVGDLKDPGLDYNIDFGLQLPTLDYIVVGSLRGVSGNHNTDTTGVVSIVSQGQSGIVIHVNEYSHDLAQDLYYDFMLVSKT